MDNTRIPNLATLAPQLLDTRLNFRIAVGDPERPFPIQGLHVALSSTKKNSNNSNKQKQQQRSFYSTTGTHDSVLLDDNHPPFYINEQGMQPVEFEQPSWEITWRRNRPHGHLVCSFVNPQTLQRQNDNDDDNDSVVFPAGRFFLYHRVWTTTTLASERERRRGLQAQAATYLKERDAHVEQIMNPDEPKNGANNNGWASKLQSYGRAAQSMNRFRTLGLKEAQFVPLFDDQVLELLAPSSSSSLPVDDGLVLSTRGRIFAVVGGADTDTNSSKNNNRRRRRRGGGEPEYIGESRVDFFNNTKSSNSSSRDASNTDPQQQQQQQQQ